MYTNFPNPPKVEELCATEDTHAHRKQVYHHEGLNLVLISEWLDGSTRPGQFDLELKTEHAEVALKKVNRDFLLALSDALKTLLSSPPKTPPPSNV